MVETINSLCQFPPSQFQFDMALIQMCAVIAKQCLQMCTSLTVLPLASSAALQSMRQWMKRALKAGYKLMHKVWRLCPMLFLKSLTVAHPFMQSWRSTGTFACSCVRCAFLLHHPWFPAMPALFLPRYFQQLDALWSELISMSLKCQWWWWYDSAVLMDHPFIQLLP